MGFKHHFILSRDSRLYKLINEEGARGYGSYLFILEQLYSQESGRLFIGQLKLIRQKGFPQAYLEKIVRNYSLFVIKDDMFSSAIDYLGTSRKKAKVSKKNTTGKGAEEEEVMTDRMKVAEETGPVAEEASPLVEEDGDFQAATPPATAAEVPEACAATPDELVADCLPTACRLPAGSESASSPKRGKKRDNSQCLSKLPHQAPLARAREEKNREEENRKYLLHIIPPLKVEEVEKRHTACAIT